MMPLKTSDGRVEVEATDGRHDALAVRDPTDRIE